MLWAATGFGQKRMTTFSLKLTRQRLKLPRGFAKTATEAQPTIMPVWRSALPRADRSETYDTLHPKRH